jgi:ribosomal protein L22
MYSIIGSTYSTEKGEDTTGWYFSEEYVEPIIEYITNRMSHNESVRSKMTGRSVEDIKKSLEKMNSENKLITIRKYDLEDNYTDKELNDMFEKTAIRVSDILMRDYDFHYEDNAYQWALSHRNGILDLLEKGYLMTDLVFKLMMGYDRPDEDDWLFGNDTNESLRDKMTPKSRREIIDNIRKMSSEDYEEHVSDEIISHNMFMLLSNDHKNREFYRQITRDGHKKGILPSESAKAIFDLYHQLNNTGFYKKRIE